MYDDKSVDIGTSSDLKLYHNGSHSYIDNKTGNLYIRANTDSDVGGDIHIRAKAGENSLSCLDDGAVQLYHDNSLKLETLSSGARVTGNLEFNNSSTRIEEGNSNALRLRTDSGYVDIGPMNTSFCHIQTDRAQFYFNVKTQFNGHVEPYGNNVHNLGSSSNRWLDVFAQNLNITKASGNLSAYIIASNGLGTIEVGGSTGAFIDLKHPTSDDYDVRLGASSNNGYLNVINNFTLTTNAKNSLYAAADAGTHLYFNGSERLQTTNTGVKISTSGDSALLVSGTTTTVEDIHIQNTSSGGECRIGFQQQDSDGLHHRGYIRSYKGSNDGTHEGTIQIISRGKTFSNGGLRLETGNGGNAVFEYHVLPHANNTYDLGSSSYRWRNVYTNDLNLSNEGGGGNDVDGTTGNYTIQEGADELYLINNKSGKKYKFNLTEVS